jgi:hypothetical protein
LVIFWSLSRLIVFELGKGNLLSEQKVSLTPRPLPSKTTLRSDKVNISFQAPRHSRLSAKVRSLPFGFLYGNEQEGVARLRARPGPDASDNFRHFEAPFSNRLAWAPLAMPVIQINSMPRIDL